MNLLHAALSFAPGGRREAIRTLVRELTAQGVQSDLACIERLGCEVDELYEFGSATELNRDQVGKRKAVVRLAELCDQRRVDLIHTHDAASQWLATCVRLIRPKIKMMMTFHRSLEFESVSWKSKLRNALAGLATSTIVVGSRARRNHYLCANYVSPAKVQHIPFGIDVTRFRPNPAARQSVRQELGIDKDKMVIGVIGHFGREKGIDVAIEAFLAMKHWARPAVLLIVGRGTAAQEELLRSLAKPAKEAIHFAGFRPDVERYLPAMDILLHVPRQEAFGLVVAEAMACGLPVVGAATGGIPEIVRDGKTGLIVPSENPAQIGVEMSRLLMDEMRRKRMSTESQRVAHVDFSAELYAQRHLNLYRQILGSPPQEANEIAATQAMTVLPPLCLNGDSQVLMSDSEKNYV